MLRRLLLSISPRKGSGHRSYTIPLVWAGAVLGLLGIVILISCGTKDPLQSAANPTDYYVSAQSGDDSSTGKIGDPFMTIQLLFFALETTSL